MDVMTIYEQELKLSLRQHSFFMFLLLFILLLVMISSIQKQVPNVGEYTNISATLMNVILYLLPIITLLLGSFSLTHEKEQGNYSLLLTYPLSSKSYILGKYLGQLTAQWVVISLSFAFTGLFHLLFSLNIEMKWLLLLYFFSILVLILFLSMAILIGSLTSNRWQALMMSMIIWFIFIMVWPLLLLSTLTFLPYPWIQPTLFYMTLFNPAECMRIMLTVQLGGGAVFGQPYYVLMEQLTEPLGIISFYLYCFVFTSVHLLLSIMNMERKRSCG